MMRIISAGVRRVVLLAMVSALASMLGCAAEKTVTLEFSSFEQFDACTRDVHIDILSNRDTVQLTPVDYIVEDTGNRLGSAGPNTAWGKKVFMLDAPAAAGATVYTFRAVKATFNGVPLAFKAMPYDGAWLAADIPANALKAGANELVMQSCAVPVDVEATQTRHSFVSTDGGTTWKPVAGEFLAHLRVYRYPSAGTITSDVIDLANPEGNNIICPQISVKTLSLAAAAQAPKGTAVTLEARSGSTTRPDDGWSAWAPAKKVQPARFLQWRAVLATKNRVLTPGLESVTITAKIDVKADPAGVTVTEFNNPRIVRSSLPFTYQEPSDKLAFLRKNWKLDAIVAPGRTEMDKYLLLRNWVRLQWPHNEGNCARPWDAIDILNAPAGDHGMCVHYGVTFTQCALALGYNARQIILNNHYVSEVWVNDLQKWVLLDVEAVQKEGWDRYGTAIYLNKDTGAPLNGLELHRALTGNALDKVTQVLSMSDDKATFTPYERTYGPEEYGNFRHFAFPPRNNFLDQLDPWEVRHGVDNYHSNYYYWWSDTPVATRAEYSSYTCRERDLYWTINQAALTLTATAEKNTLDVVVDTETPNFQEFRYSLNGGGWQALDGDGDGQTSRTARLTWELRPGANILEIKPRSTFGMDGITTKVAVEVK